MPPARTYELRRRRAAVRARRELLANENVIGWFQGRMEFGPRALGGRSIIGDRAQREDAVGDEPEDQVPRIVPAVRAVRVWPSACRDYFELDRASPYMLLVAPVREELRIPLTEAQKSAVRHRQAESEALATARRSRTSITRRASRPCTQTPIRGTSRAVEGVRAAHRLRRAGQHVVQRARRTDRLHAGGRVSLLHAHRDGLSRHRELPASPRPISRR